MHLPVLPIVTLARQHGPVAAVAVIATIKFVKFRIVTWRCSAVNEEIRCLVRKRTGTGHVSEKAISSDDAAIAAPVAGDSAGQLCVVCQCPIWVRYGEQDCAVRLLECGCLMHEHCVAKIATKQHGVALPDDVTDLDHIFRMLQRFFGVKSVTVEDVRCPRCSSSSRSWSVVAGQLTHGAPNASSSLAPVRRERASVLAALRNENALCIESLRQALLSAADSDSNWLPYKVAATMRTGGSEGSLSGPLKRWRDAAWYGEDALCTLLRHRGAASAAELSQVLAHLGSEASEGSDDEIVDRVRVQLQAAPVAARERKTLASGQELSTQVRKSYSDFLLWG